MAEPWIKLRDSIVRSAKIRGLMRVLHCPKHTALGLAVHWLTFLDEQTTDGYTGLLPDELDDELGFRGCAEALFSIGWAAQDDDHRVYAVEFDKYNGSGAKSRAENARRVAKCKANKRKTTQEVTEKVTENRYQGNEKTLPGNENSLPNNSQTTQNRKKTEESTPEGNEKTLPDKIRGDKSNEYIAYESKTMECTKIAQAHPETSDQVLTYLSALPMCMLQGDELATCATCFFNEFEAVGWVGKNGNPIRDWRATARAFMARWQQNSRSRSAGGNQQPIRYRSEMPKNYDL